MTLWRAILWATLASCLTGLCILAWFMIPPTWIIPVVCGFLVVFIGVDVFVWCYWLNNK